jgi:WhiB family redox-sensing transcriptional regulator
VVARRDDQLDRADREWLSHAACKGPLSEAFYPPVQFERKEERRAREQRAKAVCAGCPVREACLDYALRIREPHGIWGGYTEAERRGILGI